jgi:glycerol-3-phosphate dehydrogenase
MDSTTSAADAPGPSGDSALNAAQRERDLRSATESGDTDIIVIGGGFTGVGVALDAASRGLSVTLVERGDLASGTSAWSSKLAHGGLRYLARADVAIAWESAVERGRLMNTIAPHISSDRCR